MELWIAQVGVNDQCALAVLPHDDLRQICRSERLPLFWQGACYKQFRERLLFPRLIQTGAQSSEFLHSGGMLFAAEEQHRLGIGTPLGLAAARQRNLR